MATRFGASSPAQSFAARIKWLVGGLIAVILVLVLTLVVVSKSSSPAPTPTDNSNVAVATPQSPTVSILYTTQRIEANTALMPYMFDEQPVSPDKIPEGAVLGRDKATVVGKFAKVLLQPRVPLRRDDVSEAQKMGILPKDIPPGYRAVTITVDARSGVEGWAQPGTRVDVLLSYNDKTNGKKVATVVNFSKVLSVGGMTNTGQAENKAAGTTTITLLVTELDAKKIELARSIGTLSLALVGDTETGKAAAPSEAVDTSFLFPQGEKNNPPSDTPEPDGVMWAPDPDTGKNCKYELWGRKWKKGECS